ncbi:MAG: amidohydrolase [Deltaproteobacteria bacterium]|nr:amidohydrolase [Deltaproteobacteria bacterium]
MTNDPVLTRRGLLAATAAGLAAGAVGCGGDRDTTESERAALERQREEEAARSGRGPFGALRFEGYRGLAKLPWFELDAAGRLRVRGDVPRAIDLHCHLGMSPGFAPPVDLLRETPRVEYELDCDAAEPACELDLDVYVNSNFTPALLGALRRDSVRGLVLGSRAARTHTIPNLVAEMDAAGVERATVLPIAFGLPFEHDLTAHVLDSIERAGAGGRLVPFASVHPRDASKREKLRAYAARGARGVKLHPEFQRFYPDAPEAMEVYEECDRLGLPVIFHCGRSGIEPAFLRGYALPRHFVRALESFPRVRFILGHSGARDVADALPIARRLPNVWLEVSSQGVTSIAGLVDAAGERKVVYGTDWPFYPLAVSLAKVLIVTEGRPDARRAILHENAEQILAS